MTARALTAALELGAPVDVLVAGQNVGAAAAAAAQARGRRQGARRRRSGSTRMALAEPLAALIVSLAGGYDAIVAPSTANAKNVAPRVAALLDVMQVSDITKVHRPEDLRAADLRRQRDPDGRSRPIRRSSSPCAPPLSRRRARAARRRSSRSRPLPDPGVSSFVGEALAKSDRPELTSAKIIISGGRAMQKAENFKTYIEPVADKLGAAMGASRAAVDAGYAPNDWQVGQTGKVVAPELYIAVGISGAIQHLAGMKDSKVIVAINKDEEAPIFQVADYGLVADLYTALPELAAELAKIGR